MPDGLSNNVKNLVLEKHGVLSGLKDAPNRTTEGVNEMDKGAPKFEKQHGVEFFP